MRETQNIHQQKSEQTEDRHLLVDTAGSDGTTTATNSSSTTTTRDADIVSSSLPHEQRQQEKESSSLIKTTNTNRSSGNNGYVADASSSNSRNESSSENDLGDLPSGLQPSDHKIGWVIDITKRRGRSSSRRRRRRHRRSRRHHGSGVDTDENHRHQQQRQQHKNINSMFSTKLGLPLSSFPLSKPAPSPVHPEIDVSLTKLVVSTSPFLVGTEIGTTTKRSIADPTTTQQQQQQQQQPESTGVVLSSSVNAMEVLSDFVLNYFGGPTPIAGSGVDCGNGCDENGFSQTVVVSNPLSASFLEATSKLKGTATATNHTSTEESGIATTDGADFRGTKRTTLPSRKRKHSSRNTKSHQSRSEKNMMLMTTLSSQQPSAGPMDVVTSTSSNNSDNNNTNNDDEPHNMIFPQVISYVATFSTSQYTLEDALELTDTPRLLLEATAPHRVIHANAAFSNDVILMNGRNGHNKKTKKAKNSSITQRRPSVLEWMEERNKQPYHYYSVGGGNGGKIARLRTLEEAIEDIIPDNVRIPFTCYPVCGTVSGRVITHYLLEGTKNISSNPHLTVARRHQQDHDIVNTEVDNLNNDDVDNNNDDQGSHSHKSNNDFDMIPSRAIG